MMRRIVLTTDLTAEGEPAFALSLALALACRARLEILHVGRRGEEPDWEHFPRVRQTLARWGLLPPGAAKEEVGARLGIEVVKIELHGHDAAAGIADYVARHTPDLLLAASHGRSSPARWLAGSVAIEAMRRTALPTLILGPRAASPVDPATGALGLTNALFAAALSPPPFGALRSFGDLFGFASLSTHVVHVIEREAEAEELAARLPQVSLVPGDVVASLLGEAKRRAADLIVMPTDGQLGFIEMLRGSTTQRVLVDAPCPVLAMPA